MRWSLLSLALIVGCASGPHSAASSMRAASLPDSVAAVVTGTFADDYDNRFTITRDHWAQLPHGRFNIVRWDVGKQFLIAQNDSTNRYAPGKWTRIDWVMLPNMAPYAWAFCLSAYEAPSMAAAETTSVAKRDTPRTGCNGFPFSRMRRVAAGP